MTSTTSPFSELSRTNKRHLDPDSENNPKRRRTATNTNAKFDRMIETMSVVHTHGGSRSGSDISKKLKKGRGRNSRSADDAYSPLPPVHLKNDLSFIKMDSNPSVAHKQNSDDMHSSDSVELIVSEPSGPGQRTCNPLPTWLANTFMSLSKKHPLRLLLPLDLARPSSEEPVTKPKQAVEQPNGYTSPDLSYASSLPVDGGSVCYVESQDLEFRQAALQADDGDIYPDTLCDPQAVTIAAPLPFSTPGPGSLLGSSVASRTVFSLPSPQRSSSATLYYDESYLSSDRPYTPEPHLRSALNQHADLYTEYTDQSDADPIPVDLGDSPYFSDIYATPGPVICAPPMHFDSPTEDPLQESEPNLVAYKSELAYEDIDFHWKPFDRKHLVVPAISRAPVFNTSSTHAPGTSVTHPIDFDHQNTTTTPDTTRFPMNSPFELEQSQQTDSPPTVKPPVSPSPFRFSAPNNSSSTAAVHSAIVPESQDMPRVEDTTETAIQPHTPPLQKLPLVWVPGVDVSPLGLSPKEPSSSSRLTGKRNAIKLAASGSIQQKSKNLPNDRKNITQKSMLLVALDKHIADTENSLGPGSGYSQILDKSWEE